jgi:hypothetical protein
MQRIPTTAGAPRSGALAHAALLAAGLMLSAGAAAAPADSDAADARVRSLERQLAEVQTQLRTLAAENQALRERQLEIERQLGQHAAAGRQLEIERQLGQHAAAGPASGAPGEDAAAASLARSAPPASAAPVPAEAPAGQDLKSAAAAPPGAASGPLRLWGYGEIYYSYPTEAPQRAQADLARAVFGIGYVFDPRTEFNSEYELEHAVSSSSDVGEFEIEQFYVDRRLSDAVTLRAGLFLMPFGLLNEHHEPVNFYGMQRNFVETLIIPSTWREGGVNLHGDTVGGFGWNVGVTTGFDLSKWDYTPQFPPYATALELEASNVAPLQATHQELALANAEHLSPYAALSYYGVPGLTLGGAVTSGYAVKTTVPAPASVSGQQRVTLWEAHARWTPGPFDLSTVYAHGSISNLAATNAAYPGSANPIPSAFYGYFLQGAWSTWQRGEYRAALFVRWERYDMGSSYQGTPGPVLPPGLVPLGASSGDLGYWPQNHDQVWTAGANFYIGPHVVLKADYQWFEVNQDLRRFDLGLGVAF